MASAATPYRPSWGPGPPPLRYPPPPQHQQQVPPQPGLPLLPQQLPVQQAPAPAHYHHTQTPHQVGPPMHHNTHTQYSSGARVPTAASPSNTTSSSSSATGSQSGTLSTSLSNNNAGAGVPPEQLSRTNLYIRGLTQTTTDKDLVSMCHQYGTIISTKAILDKNTNKCKGYGFVDFESVGSAEEAVKGLQANGVQAQMAKVGIWLLRRPNSQQEQDPTNLYMANLPPDFKENDVDNLLKNFGQVVSTRILRDPYGQSKGVGFARMESRDKCEQIIQVFNGNAIAGAKEPLLVKFADGGNKKKSQYKVPERSAWREPMDPTHQLLCGVTGAGGPVYGCGAGGELGVGVGVGGMYQRTGGVYVSGYPMTSHWVPAPYPIMQPAHHMQPHHIDPQEYAMQVSRGERAVGLVLPEPSQQYPAQLLPHTLQLAPPQYMAPHPYSYMSSTGSLLHALPMEPDHSTAASPDEPYQPYPPK